MKRILVISLLLLLGCTPDESNMIYPPSDFDIQVKSTVYTNVFIDWSNSFDPDEGIIFYKIILENSLLVDDLTTSEYTITDLEPLTEYYGSIIAYTTENNERSKSFSFETDGNLAPNKFEIKTINTENTSIQVNWDESIDPEGERVSYNIYLNKTLIKKDYYSTSYTFNDLSPATSYQLKIDAIDSSSNTTLSTLEITTKDGIYDGDVSLASQNAIEDFGEKGYVEITGDLKLSDPVGSFSDISDLSPLKTIKKVNGYFDINLCQSLTTLSGLGIEQVGKSFRINSNRNLETLEGLENLEKVYDVFEIQQNSNLKTIHSLNKLNTIGSSIIIHNNGNLLTIQGLNNLITVEGIYINSNGALQDISGFNKLTQLEYDFKIAENPKIFSITGFEKFKRAGRFYLEDTLITHIDIFSSLERVTELSIINNSELTNLKGLNSLTEITYGDLTLVKNYKITSLEGLENINLIGGTYIITYNTLLSDLCALQNLLQDFNPTHILTIRNNAYNPTLTQITNGNCN